MLIALAGFCRPVQADDLPTAWQLIDDGDPNPGHGLLDYDSSRGRIVRLIGGGGDSPPYTWELAGDDWVRRFIPEPTPWLGAGGCSSYDEDRGVTVVFGGPADETWEYDGSHWVMRSPVTRPSARYMCGMVFDLARHRIVMYGGEDITTHLSLGDTWEYDGTDWTPVYPKGFPPRRQEVGMAYDADRQRVVLFGGSYQGLAVGGTWEYDGISWTPMSPSSSPSPRIAPGMTYDPVREKTVLFGGATTAQDYGDTWEWNGSNWTQVFPPQAPSSRYRFRLVYDAARGKVVGHAGEPFDGDVNDTWAYDGTTWTQIALSGLPHIRAFHGMAYSPTLDATVLYGGRNHYPDGPLWDTWHFANGSWARQEGVGAPTASYDFALSYDAGEDRIVAFSGGPPDTHEYRGSPPLWSSLALPGPDEHIEHGWVNAPSLGGTLLFGGRACCSAGGGWYRVDDTWTLQGSAWVRHYPPHKPAARDHISMAFDSLRGRAILYGGLLYDGYPGNAETWFYDGQDWQMYLQSSPPGGRLGHSLIYDPARDRIVLYGDGPAVEGVTWEFDGVDWVARPTSFQPDTDRRGFQLAYDSKRGIVLLFGGHDTTSNVVFNDTWAYGPDPDGDGIVGGLDNCRDTPNANQLNLDGDPAGDACDCAVSDPGSWGVPVEVTNLRAAGITDTNLTWEDQALLAGPGVRYDLVSGMASSLRISGGFSGAACLQDDLAGAGYTDSRTPPASDGFYYLVRSVNICGLGTYGAGSDGLPRNIAVCP